MMPLVVPRPAAILWRGCSGRPARSPYSPTSSIKRCSAAIDCRSVSEVLSPNDAMWESYRRVDAANTERLAGHAFRVVTYPAGCAVAPTGADTPLSGPITCCAPPHRHVTDRDEHTLFPSVQLAPICAQPRAGC